MFSSPSNVLCDCVHFSSLLLTVVLVEFSIFCCDFVVCNFIFLFWEFVVLIRISSSNRRGTYRRAWPCFSLSLLLLAIFCTGCGSDLRAIGCRACGLLASHFVTGRGSDRSILVLFWFLAAFYLLHGYLFSLLHVYLLTIWYLLLLAILTCLQCERQPLCSFPR